VENKTEIMHYILKM